MKATSGDIPDNIESLRNTLIGVLAANGPADPDSHTPYFREMMKAARKGPLRYNAENISTITLFDHILKATSISEDAYFSGILLMVALVNAIFEEPKLARKHSNIGMGVCRLIRDNIPENCLHGVFRPEFPDLFRSFFNGVRLALLAGAREYKSIKSPETREKALEASALSFEDCALFLTKFKLENSTFEQAVYYLKTTTEIEHCLHLAGPDRTDQAASNAWVCLESRKRLKNLKTAEALTQEIFGKEELARGEEYCQKGKQYRSMLNRPQVEEFVAWNAEEYIL